MEEVGVSRSAGASAIGPVCRGTVRANKISGAVSVYVGSGSRKEWNRKSVPITLFTCSLAHLACKTKFVVSIVFVGQKTLGGFAAPIFFKLEVLTT